MTPLAAEDSIEKPSNLKLPAELWFDIIKQLATRDLKNLSMICKSMRFLTIPVLFHHARLVLYSMPHIRGDWRRRSLRLFKARLKFWKSVQIAPLVQSCEIVRLLPSTRRNYDPVA